MEKKTMGLIAAVVVVVVVIAAIALVMSGDKDNGPDIPEVASGTGTVYGNADGNCFIDETDVAIIESIIAGDRDFKDFPFADANCDGEINQTDVQLVKDMIAKKSMKVKVLDTQDKVVEVQYPVDSFIVLAGSNLAPLMNVLDASDKVVAAAYSTLDPIRDYDINKGIEDGKIVKLTTNGTAADLDAISKLKTNVMLTEYSAMYDLDSDENIKTLNAWNIDVLCMECRDPGDDTRSMAVFGILLDRGKEAQGYIDFVEDVYDQIKKVEGTHFGERTVIISSLASSLCGRSSGYTTMIEEMAGGKNVADWENNTKTVKVGDTWIFADKYKSDIAFFGTASNYKDTGFTDKAIAGYAEKYSNLEVWKNDNAYIYSTSIPVVCRVAYYAEAMYPDLFTDGWANGIHQKFVDTYFGTSFTVNEEQFFKKISS